MKLFLILVALLIPIPVFAIDASTMQSIEDYCQTTKAPQWCLTSFLDDARAFAQTRAREEERNFQLALARESSRSTDNALALMWLFSGPTYIPYQIPPATSSPIPIAPTFRTPLTCQSYAVGHAINTACY
jgi:hypothetical protein